MTPVEECNFFSGILTTQQWQRNDSSENGLGLHGDMRRSPLNGQATCLALIIVSVLVFLVHYYFRSNFITSALQRAREEDELNESAAPVSANFSKIWFGKLENLSKLVLTSHKLSPSPDNVFFVETSCARKTGPPRSLVLNSKQACSIYSTALHNPSRRITLFYTCPLLQNYYSNSSDVVKSVLDLPNVFVAEVNLIKFFSDTMLSEFLNGVLTESAYPVEHNSDLLRILLLYMYGGTYMDLDVISIRPLDGMGSNFIGAEEPFTLGSAVINFDANHEYLKHILMKAFKVYDPSAWTSVGPLLVTSALRELCNISEHIDLQTVGFVPSCNVTVKGYEVFYPIRYFEWELYYKSNTWNEVEPRLNEAYVVHVWNHMSDDARIVVGSNQPYGKLAQKHCPAVYYKSGRYFS